MPAKLNETALHTTALYDQAASLLEKKLITDPNNTQLLRLLVDNSRQRGQLQAAKVYCERLLCLEPDHTHARYLHTILHEKPLDIQSDNMLPAPFIRREGILNSIEQQTVWRCIAQQYNNFKPSEVIAGSNKNIRRSQLITAKKKTELHVIKSWLIPKVKAAISDKLACFSMPHMVFGKTELQLTLHGDKDYLKTHTDVLKSQPIGASAYQYEKIKSRKISFVYYLHSLPKRFTGGELLLFDTHLMHDTYNPQHTRIAPQHNSLVLFPSQFYHQVTPVTCTADPLQHGRFTLNGWLHEK